MKLYQIIKESGIDLTPLGFTITGDTTAYYCTPEDADILGWAGVDGIHYCTIPKFSEMIFAVNPMDFGDCVHPIAKNFEDLLRLLLSVTDMSVLEQCYAWDRKQFNAFIIDCPATDEQQALLDLIKEKFDLLPIDDPFEYVKCLQSEFDLSLIPYTEDYYDLDMNPAAPEHDEPWEVYFDGSYFGKRTDSDCLGEEIVINAQFTWNDEIWHIPSIYVFPKGIVVDSCVEIDPKREKAFIDKWEPSRIPEERLTQELRRQINNENPLNVEFHPYLTVNGKLLRTKCSASTSWIPTSCLPSEERNDIKSARIIKHYGLDETYAWSFRRTAFLWTTSRESTIKSLSLKLEREAMQIDGICFKNPSVGDVITFTHPVFGTEHKLKVIEFEPQELPSNAFANSEYEFPTHHISMTYTLEPDIPNKNFQVRDKLDNDEPKFKAIADCESQNDLEASSIGIIGGADGPTVVILSDRRNITDSVYHVALSALHFEPTNDVEWKTVFREKMTEDIEVNLIP